MFLKMTIILELTYHTVLYYCLLKAIKIYKYIQVVLALYSTRLTTG